ncbi:MAG: hypothetical protein HY298_20985 [Verrucomicrobia bacterium]|nr:hypothetical protein [Verrucomicrobiota bacterium]
MTEQGGEHFFYPKAGTSRLLPTQVLRSCVRVSCLVALAAGACATSPDEPPSREIVAGITTTRIVPGEPYDLAGKRVVFANWYYVQPGDLDWRDAEGKSVYVHGNSGLFDAHHVGANAPSGIRIVAQKPNVIGPLNIPHRTILRDGNLYKGWTSTEYLESSDGMQWQKKADLLHQGSKSWDGPAHVFIDPVAPPTERFKTVWNDDLITRAEFDEFRKKRPDGWEPRSLLHVKERGVVSCIRGSVSPDGIHWTTLPDPLVVEYADTLNTCYYDTVLRKYVLYTRHWSVGPRASMLPADIRNSWTGVGRRAIGRSESADFRSFPPSEMIIEPTPDMLPSEALYTNCRTSVPGAPDQHLMFPTAWNASIDDTTRIAMASSHDGKVWHWVPGGDLLRTQPFGQWNGGCIWVNPELIELPNGDWSLQYTGHNVPHKYPRGQRIAQSGYAVWPKGRMVSLEADGHGEFTMIPIIAPGRILKINAITLRTGWIKVEVAGKDGRTFADCTPIVGDQPWVSVTWKGGKDLVADPGQPTTLRFQLYQAKLFGLEFD